MQNKLFVFVRWITFGLMPLLSACGVHAEPLAIQEKDSIVFLGNTFAERLHRFGYFETFLHCRFPDHHLRIRNMGWSADEVDKMDRGRDGCYQPPPAQIRT